MSNKWPYLAAMLDAEGTICMYVTAADSKQPNHCSLQVVIYNTSIVLMKWFVTNFGGKFYTRTKQTGLIKSSKEQYAWHPSGSKNREKILLGVLPYLVVKKEQAKLALEFLRIGDQVKSPELRRELAAKCSRLNRGEESVTTNTLNSVTPDGETLMRESELLGDQESTPDVNQGLDIDHCPKCKEYLHDEMGHMCPV
jgi:hypothetical protein